MEQLRLQVPKMWADHHVQVVRSLLQGLGVQEVEASAARQFVRLSFDPQATPRDRILQTLADAGYTPTETAEYPEPLANKDLRSAWFGRDPRVTQTNRLDLEMSGDFRKY